MADSTLQHDEITPPTVTKGHGTAALGPSDSSDSGSDIQGGPGSSGEEGLFTPAGMTSDDDVDASNATAGADSGDANLDSDSDRNGTGERAAVGYLRGALFQHVTAVGAVHQQANDVGVGEE